MKETQAHRRAFITTRIVRKGMNSRNISDEIEDLTKLKQKIETAPIQVGKWIYYILGEWYCLAYETGF